MIVRESCETCGSDHVLCLLCGFRGCAHVMAAFRLGVQVKRLPALCRDVGPSASTPHGELPLGSADGPAPGRA
jgi:hypothetical protein